MIPPDTRTELQLAGDEATDPLVTDGATGERAQAGRSTTSVRTALQARSPRSGSSAA